MSYLIMKQIRAIYRKEEPEHIRKPNKQNSTGRAHNCDPIIVKVLAIERLRQKMNQYSYGLPYTR